MSKMRSTRNLMTGLGVAALIATSAVAHATVITFNNLHATGTGQTLLPSYSSQGFLFTDLDDTGTPTGHPDAFASFHTGSPFYAGSTALADSRADDQILFTTVNPGTFSITSIDLSALYPPTENLTVGGEPISGPGVSEVTFIGTTATSAIVTDTFTVDSFGFTTFDFTPDFTDLVSLKWTQVADFHQFDNLTVDFVPAKGGVPEPGAPIALLFGVIGIAVLGMSARTRQQGRSSAA